MYCLAIVHKNNTSYDLALITSELRFEKHLLSIPDLEPGFDIVRLPNSQKD